MKFIHTKFPNFNVGNFKNNDLKFYEDIEHIKNIDYLAELDIRNNPLSKTPAIQDTIVYDVPNLEVYNDIELLEPGYKFKLENEQIKKYLEDTKDKEDDTVYEGIIEDAFIKIAAETGEKLTATKLKDKFEEAEKNHLKNDAELVKAQMNISANLVPLTRDVNRIKDLQESTNEDLLKESKEFRKKVKSDYESLRQQFRHVVNQLRFDEMETFDKLNINSDLDPIKNDPYEEMKKESRRLDNEQKINRAKFGFMTSKSEKSDNSFEDDSKEAETMIRLDQYERLNRSASKNTKRKTMSVKKNPSKKTIPFRSSAGFKNTKANDITIKKKPTRAESARKTKLPPRVAEKEKLNDLKELKMNQEKDKIMDEFNKIVYKTSTSFKEPKFPKSTRKNVLEPIRTMSQHSVTNGDGESGVTALKNITKYTKPGMLSAQNDAIREMIRSKIGEN